MYLVHLRLNLSAMTAGSSKNYNTRSRMIRFYRKTSVFIDCTRWNFFFFFVNPPPFSIDLILRITYIINIIVINKPPAV